MHWAKFNLAEEAVENVDHGFIDSLSRGEKLMMESCHLAINKSMRFYFPSNCAVINWGNVTSEEIKSVFKLPYPAVAVLTDSLSDGSDWSIIVAMTFELDNVEQIVLYELAYVNNKKKWVVAKSFGTIYFDDNNNIQTKVGWFGSGKEFSHLDRGIETETFFFVLRVFLNFLMVLSLHNVKTEKIIAGQNLNKKRKATGKKLLYEYHVLNVGGQRWDSKRDDESDSEYGFRSHMRRGHIRKIQSGRFVWVSACFVHGSVPGFVDKEYAIK